MEKDIGLTRFLFKPLIFKIMSMVILASEKVYLNGIPVWTYYSNETFYRLGKYLEHGVCYEASALLMLTLKDYRKTRYVLGVAKPKKQAIKHAWIEMKAYGIWWVLDSTWITSAVPIPKIVYRYHIKTRATRILSHKEFFSLELTQELAELIKEPETSFVFNNLAAFRRNTNATNDCMLFEVYGSDFFKADESGWSYWLINIFGPKKPMTPRILRDLVMKDTRKSPKMRTIRKAFAFSKTISQAIEDAKAYKETRGKKAVILITSPWAYSLLSLEEAEEMGLAPSS